MLTNVMGYLEVYMQQLERQQSVMHTGTSTEAEVDYSAHKDLTSARHLTSHVAYRMDVMSHMHGIMPVPVLTKEVESLQVLAADVPLVKASKAHAAIAHRQLNIALSAMHHYHDAAIQDDMAALQVLASLPVSSLLRNPRLSRGTSRIRQHIHMRTVSKRLTTWAIIWKIIPLVLPVTMYKGAPLSRGTSRIRQHTHMRTVSKRLTTWAII
jgi:hypothetical protein